MAKKTKSEGVAKIYISASFNNTLVNICDDDDDDDEDDVYSL